MVFPNEQVLDVSISILLQVPPSYSQAPPSPAPIAHSPHVVAPLCKRKSPWINECVSCCFSQSLVHCGKLINQAEVLQKDLSKEEVIVQSPEVLSLFYKLTCQVNNKVSGECPGSCLASANDSVTSDFRQTKMIKLSDRLNFLRQTWRKIRKRKIKRNLIQELGRICERKWSPGSSDSKGSKI